jgi:hypothetical protein
MLLNIFFCLHFTVSITGEVGKFVLVVIVVEGGDVTGELCLFQICSLAANTAMLHCVSGKSDSSNLLILSKMAEIIRKL